jgi:hypothetical protein
MCLQCRGSRREPQNGAWLLQGFLGAAELEMQEAEEPIKANRSPQHQAELTTR